MLRLKYYLRYKVIQSFLQLLCGFVIVFSLDIKLDINLYRKGKWFSGGVAPFINSILFFKPKEGQSTLSHKSKCTQPGIFLKDNTN